jgi:hypothetical protein
VGIKWILERTAKVCEMSIYVTLHKRKIFQPYSITHYCDDINFVLAEAVLFWAVKHGNERNFRPNGYINVFGTWSVLTLLDALLNFNLFKAWWNFRSPSLVCYLQLKINNALLLRITCYCCTGADWMGTQSKVTINILLRILQFTEFTEYKFRLERTIYIYKCSHIRG